MKPGIQARRNPGGRGSQQNHNGDDGLVPALAGLDVATLGEQLGIAPQKSHGRNARGEVESHEHPRIRPIQASGRSEKTYRRDRDAEEDRDEPSQNRSVHHLAQEHILYPFQIVFSVLADRTRRHSSMAVGALTPRLVFTADSEPLP